MVADVPALKQEPTHSFKIHNEYRTCVCSLLQPWPRLRLIFQTPHLNWRLKPGFTIIGAAPLPNEIEQFKVC